MASMSNAILPVNDQEPDGDGVTFGCNTAHFGPFDGDGGQSDAINPWSQIVPLHVCPYCYCEMEWEDCLYCEGGGNYDGKPCPLCGAHGGWWRCDDCDLLVVLPGLADRSKGGE
jgi:hypothetical protein